MPDKEKARTKRAREDLREASRATRRGTRVRGREKRSQRGRRGREGGHARPDRGSGQISAAHHSGNVGARAELGGGGDSARSTPLHAHWCPPLRSQSHERQPSPQSLSNK